MKDGYTPLRFAAMRRHPEVVRLLLEYDAESKTAVCTLAGCGRRCRAHDPHKALMRCAGCLAAAYCGRAHQVEDWPRHKAECRAAVTSSAAVAAPTSE